MDQLSNMTIEKAAALVAMRVQLKVPYRIKKANDPAPLVPDAAAASPFAGMKDQLAAGYKATGDYGPNTLIGAGAGAGVGLLAAALSKKKKKQYLRNMLLGGTLGGLGGAGITGGKQLWNVINGIEDLPTPEHGPLRTWVDNGVDYSLNAVGSAGKAVGNALGFGDAAGDAGGAAGDAGSDSTKAPAPKLFDGMGGSVAGSVAGYTAGRTMIDPARDRNKLYNHARSQMSDAQLKTFGPAGSSARDSMTNFNNAITNNTPAGKTTSLNARKPTVGADGTTVRVTGGESSPRRISNKLTSNDTFPPMRAEVISRVPGPQQQYKDHLGRQQMVPPPTHTEIHSLNDPARRQLHTSATEDKIPKSKLGRRVGAAGGFGLGNAFSRTWDWIKRDVTNGSAG